MGQHSEHTERSDEAASNGSSSACTRGLCRILHGDCLELLKDLPDNCADAVITDPPYGTTQLEWDDAQDWPALWTELNRVAKEAAVIVVFSVQPFASDLIQTNREAWRYEIIWIKTMGTRFLDANRRPLAGHENIQVFTRRMNEATYNPQKWNSGVPYQKAGSHGLSHYNGVRNATSRSCSGERHPLSFLRFSNGNNGNVHPSQKPLDLMRWLVRSYTDAGDMVLDPFAGSGSTGAAGLREGRQFIGIECEAEYVEIAERRCQDIMNTPGLFDAA